MPEFQHSDVGDLMERRRFTLIAGPCVVEGLDLCLEVAHHVADLCRSRGIAYIFKASFDKANRTSGASYRGNGMARGLEILAQVRAQLGIPTLTDIHLPEQAAAVAAVVDVLQIPAFLCRQTDLLQAAAATGRPTNIKKGQFMAPEDMRHVVAKFCEGGHAPPCITERGTTFGYHNLVVDMRGLVTMRSAGAAAIIFDATHAVQRPGGLGATSGGEREMAPVLARAAASVGIDALFCEVHPQPERALSDGPNSMTFDMLARCLDDVLAIQRALYGLSGTDGAGTAVAGTCLTNSASI